MIGPEVHELESRDHQAQRMTPAQSRTLARLIGSYHPHHVHVEYEPFDLPAGWLSFTLTDQHNAILLAGGIDREGSAAT